MTENFNCRQLSRGRFTAWGVYEASERDFRVVTITDGISNFTENGWLELQSIGVNMLTADDCLQQLSSC